MSWIKGDCLWVRRGREKQGVIIIVRRKLGNAVVRNRLKRRLRHVCRLNENNLPMSLVIFCQPHAARVQFSDLERDFTALLSKLGRA